MDQRRIVVLVIDRLGAGYLGPYGNTWIETPSWNRLAAEAFLFDFVLADSPRLGSVYRSYWQGLHALSDATGPDALAAQLSAAGLSATLLTDDRLVADLAGASSFQERIIVPWPSSSEAAVEVEETQLARLFSAAIDTLQQPEPALLWIHSQGMQGPWDAPVDFRNQFAEEEDSLPPEFVLPPQKRLVPPYEADELLGLAHSYAGQVALLDLCLGAFLDALAAGDAATRPLLIVTSPRGYPLGEHGLIGHGDDALHGESLNVPCLIRFPDQMYGAQRSRDLIQPPDVYATVLDWLSVSPAEAAVWGRSLFPLIRGESQPARDWAAARVGEYYSLRTPAWYFLRHPAGMREVYAKPDDRWEINEVVNRCEHVVEPLDRALDQFQQAAQLGSPADLPALPEVLTSGLG